MSNYPPSWFCPNCGHQNQLSFRHCPACGTALPPGAATSQPASQPAKSGFSPKWIVGIVLLGILGIGGLSVLIQSAEKASLKPNAVAHSSPSAEVRDIINTTEIQTRALRGKQLLEKINREVLVAVDKNPSVSGQLSKAPTLTLLVPNKIWNGLTKNQRVDLTWHLESLIPSVRSDPESFITIPKTAPLYQRFVEINRELCADCWDIVVGDSKREDGAPVFTMDRSVVKGDSAWERRSEYDSSVKASEFRK